MINLKKVSVLLLLSLVCAPLLAASVNAGNPLTMVTITTPSKDTCILNYAGDLNVGQGLEMIVLSFQPQPVGLYVYRSLVQFDLPTEISGKTIISVVLMIHKKADTIGNPTGVLLRACRVTHDWVEGDGLGPSVAGISGATWNEYDKTTPTENWTTPGGDYTLVDSSTVPCPDPLVSHWANFTVTNIVQGWASGSCPNYGFLIKFDDESFSPVGGVFYTKEAAAYSALDQPSMLEITYGGVAFVVPEVPLGTVVASVAMIMALAAYVGIPRLPRLNRKR